MPPVPHDPKIYHIVHVDRLASIIDAGCLYSDAVVLDNSLPGTTIGMNSIKERRLRTNRLDSHPELFVGACVPFYWCPRSIMLYLIDKADHSELVYRGGQGSIIHLEADLQSTVDWADSNGRRWAFTLSNAGAYYFEDRCDLSRLHEIDWAAVQSRSWATQKEGKQAEFLVEELFPWELVSRIGVLSTPIHSQVSAIITNAVHRPQIEIRRDWYY